MRAQRQLRFWTQNEINTALDMVNEGKDLDTIASAVERTKQGVKTMVYHFEAYKMGKQISSMSGSWREQFARYLKSNKNVAESLRDEVQEANGKVTPMGSDAKLEALLQTVETNWNQTLQAVSNLVEYEVNRRVTEEKAKNENELRELRAFKEQAKDSNIAGTLRKSLMSFRS